MIDSTLVTRSTHDRPGALLPVLRAFLGTAAIPPPGDVAPRTIEHALSRGLGPVIAHATRAAAPWTESPCWSDIQGADLVARLIAGELFESLAAVVVTANDAGCTPVLLKGVATARRYYPSPHLRTMGDIDLLLPADRTHGVSERLRALGFHDRIPRRAPDYRRHHHGIPLWHPQRSVWIELHTRLFPPDYPLGRHPAFGDEVVRGMLVHHEVGGGCALVMNHELQLVYSATRWAEMLRVGRGVFPLLDIALMIRATNPALDWNVVERLVRGSWAATAVRLVCETLEHLGLATIPRDVRRRLAALDPYGSAVTVWIQSRLVEQLLFTRDTGRFLTPRSLRSLWVSLIAPRPPLEKILTVPLNLVFPPDSTDRFGPRTLARRLYTVWRADRSS